MLFSSFLFLFWFLPVTLVLYFGLPPALQCLWRGKLKDTTLRGVQNAVLFITSLFFYAWGEPLYVLLMLGTVAMDFGFGWLIVRTTHRRAVLTLAICANLSLLIYFKYAAFLAGLLGFSIKAPRLPLGISFYTFQALSYVIDVARGEVKPAESPLIFGTYVALFPQLIAGPIVRYTDVEAALYHRTHTWEAAARGTRRFVAGLAKKMLLANAAGALFTSLVSLPSQAISTLGAWLALFAFAVQIYFDFSGYSDMAIGLGHVFGFSFPENFNYPYTAISISDFWRRWHITLGQFFRTYVYFPLGGSKHGVLRTVLALFAVWSLTGLWHGAALNFLLWGLYYFLLLVIEKLLLSRLLTHVPRLFRHAATLSAILFGWLIFAFDGSSAALSTAALRHFLAALLGWSSGSADDALYHFVRHLPFFLIAAIGATPLPRLAFTRLSKKHPLLLWLLPLLGFFLSLAYLAGAAYNPFLYFRF
ncbi:MAG: MBOAT family protein [Ruminococcaceae bacterium]|nr:MBOAT family protein [Oscillospiraceae bacterium]